MVTQAARDAAFGARLFYNGVMWYCIGMCVIYDTDLRRAILNLELLYPLGFFGLYGLSYYLFCICADNPGYVETNVANQELSSLKSDSFEGKETLLQSSSSNKANGIDIEAGGASNQEVDQEANSRTSNTKEYNDQGQRWCSHCQIYQPYRTKHCKQCERCVYKFDHHCFWIGGCVGELNHRKFWLFLFFQTVLEAWAYFIADSGLLYGYAKGEAIIKSGTKGMSSPYQTTEYGAFTVASLACILAFLFTGILLGFHTLLVLTNQSTWEFSKKDSISYLKPYPKSYNPFSYGLISNIKVIFFHGNQPTDWDLPPVPSSRGRKSFNWCENEYYSCC